MLPLHHHRLLAVQGGTGPADVCHAQIQAVLVLAGHVQNAAQGGTSVLVDGGVHTGGGRLSLAGSPLNDDYHTFAVGQGSTPTVLQ